MPCTENPPATHADLHWSEDGRIACPKHMPFPGSDSFVYGRWRRITKAQAAEFTREIGRAPECETCRSIELRQEEDARSQEGAPIDVARAIRGIPSE